MEKVDKGMAMGRPFRDRAAAGEALAERLGAYAALPDVLVLALPRGGVPVAAAVARTLAAPLDVFLVRKLGVPGHEELAMGAIATGGVRVLNEAVVRNLGIHEATIDAVAAAEGEELARREHAYRDGRPAPDVAGRTVIVVDDGLATGATMRAAVAALRRQGPHRVVVAVPVAASATCAELRAEVDDIVCALTPEPFYAVGLWYDDFAPTTDGEVHDLLADAWRAEDGADGAAHEPPVHERTARVTAGTATLDGTLSVPLEARGVVLFAHGSGSGRHSPRNRYVAGVLRDGGLATLLIDLLTADEEAADARTGHLRFDIGLLAARLAGAIDWLAWQEDTRHLAVGLFGASTGGGAALATAAERPDAVGAVVSRGGRPDLAGAALARVAAPVLLIVGGDDEPVIELNRQALAGLQSAREKRLEIVPGATHLFEEPGALDAVARLARDWFARHLAPPT